MIKLTNILNEGKIKTIDIWFEDSKGWDSWRDAEESLSKLLGWDIGLRSMDDNELEKAAKQLKKQGIKLTWDDSMDVS